jgi:predicted protein tyrosine phosphatase
VNQYIAAVEIMARNVRDGRPTLVHCHAGAQRTGGAVALYRVLIDRWTACQAVAEMNAFGHCANDNEKLLPYLNAHVGVVAQALVDRGVIDQTPSPLPTFAQR